MKTTQNPPSFVCYARTCPDAERCARARPSAQLLPNQIAADFSRIRMPDRDCGWFVSRVEDTA